MIYDWFQQYIFNGYAQFSLTGNGIINFNVGAIFAGLMFVLFLWSIFHLTTDVIMAFRVVFGFGYKKRKGGSH